MASVPGHGKFGKAHLAGWIPTISDDHPPFFDPLTTSAADLQTRLTSGTLTSVQVLNEYYRQILKYNGYLRGVYRLAPGALARAKELDEMRAEGKVLGPLHGIPVLIKDNIGTDPSMEMETTGGSLSLLGSMAKKNAPIVDRMIEAGIIIMGKATLSEMAFFKGHGIRCGWSAVHGQSQNPYIRGGIDPDDGLAGHSSTGGSSAGSGVATSAGMTPISIGSETKGSLVSPSTRHALYTIKPALASIPNEGIIPISAYLDVPGPMCTTVEDTVNLFSAIMGKGASDVPPSGYASAMKGADGWSELRVGTVDPDRYKYGEEFQKPIPEASEQMKEAMLRGYEGIKSLAKDYHADVSLRPASDYEVDGEDAFYQIMIADFESDFNKYIAGTEGSTISSARELAEWNRAHGDQALPPEYPNQACIDSALSYDPSSGKREAMMKHIVEVSKSFDDTLEKYGIDAIIGPADGPLCSFSAGTGYPLCSLPLGCIDFNGRPVGLMAIAKSHVTLITLMSAFEATFPRRVTPQAFLAKEEA